MLRAEQRSEVSCFGCAAVGLLCAQKSAASETRQVFTSEGMKITHKLDGSIFDCVVDPDLVSLEGSKEPIQVPSSYLPELDLLHTWFEVLAARGYEVPTVTPSDEIEEVSTDSYFVTLKNTLSQTVNDINLGKLKPRYESEVANQSEQSVKQSLSSPLFRRFFQQASIKSVPVNSLRDKQGADLTVLATRDYATTLALEETDLISVQVKSSESKVTEFCLDFTRPTSHRWHNTRNLDVTPFLVLNGRGTDVESEDVRQAAIAAQLVALAEIRTGIEGRLKALEMIPLECRGKLVSVLSSPAFHEQYCSALACYYARENLIWPGGKQLKTKKAGKKSKTTLPDIGKHAIHTLISHLESI